MRRMTLRSALSPAEARASLEAAGERDGPLAELSLSYDILVHVQRGRIWLRVRRPFVNNPLSPWLLVLCRPSPRDGGTPPRHQRSLRAALDRVRSGHGTIRSRRGRWHPGWAASGSPQRKRAHGRRTPASSPVQRVHPRWDPFSRLARTPRSSCARPIHNQGLGHLTNPPRRNKPFEPAGMTVGSKPATPAPASAPSR